MVLEDGKQVCAEFKYVGERREDRRVCEDVEQNREKRGEKHQETHGFQVSYAEYKGVGNETYEEKQVERLRRFEDDEVYDEVGKD